MGLIGRPREAFDLIQGSLRRAMLLGRQLLGAMLKRTYKRGQILSYGNEVSSLIIWAVAKLDVFTLLQLPAIWQMTGRHRSTY